jgi:hypothetical protein
MWCVPPDDVLSFCSWFSRWSCIMKFPIKKHFYPFIFHSNKTWPAHPSLLYNFKTDHDNYIFVLFVFLALQSFGCIFHSPVAGFNLLILEVSWSHTTTRHSR